MALALVLALALALRLRGISAFPLEGDEVYTIFESRDLFHTTLKPGITARPLYFLMQHVLLPITPVSLRALPLLFGMLGVLATWALGRRIMGPTTGLVAAFLTAISPWHLYASGMARYWSLVHCLAAACVYFLFTAYQEGRRRDYLLALATGLLGSATHPAFLIALSGLVLGLHLVRPDGRIGWRWPDKPAWFYLWLPWAGALVLAVLAVKVAGQGGAVRNWSGRGAIATLRLVPAMVQWMTPIVFTAGLMGGLACVRDPRAAVRRWGIAATVCVPAGLVLLFIAASTTDVYADYGVGLLPIATVSAGALVALGAERFRGSRNAFAGIATLVLAAGVAPSTVSHLSDGTRFDFRPALAAIATEAPGSTVLAPFEMLQRHYAPSLRVRSLRPDDRYLDSAAHAERPLWVLLPVREYGVPLDDRDVIRRWLSGRCRLVRSDQGLRFDVRLYRVELYRCDVEALR